MCEARALVRCTPGTEAQLLSAHKPVPVPSTEEQQMMTVEINECLSPYVEQRAQRRCKGKPDNRLSAYVKRELPSYFNDLRVYACQVSLHGGIYRTNSK